MRENFNNWVRGKVMQIQKAQRVPIKMNQKKLVPRHIIVKMPCIKDKKRTQKQQGRNKK